MVVMELVVVVLVVELVVLENQLDVVILQVL